MIKLILPDNSIYNHTVLLAFFFQTRMLESLELVVTCVASVLVEYNVFLLLVRTCSIYLPSLYLLLSIVGYCLHCCSKYSHCLKLCRFSRMILGFFLEKMESRIRYARPRILSFFSVIANHAYSYFYYQSSLSHWS